MENLIKKFKDIYKTEKEPELFFAPGRVNLIGEHLDYNGGYVFPAAISLGISAAVMKRDDKTIRLNSLDFENEIIYDLNKPIIYEESKTWGNYPGGIIKHISENYEINTGMDLLFSSDLPKGSGLSSSAALEVLTAYILIHEKINSDEKRVEMSLMCQKVENTFIGVQCGIMDQFAVALGKKDRAILLNSETLEYRYSKIDLESYKLIIMDTKKPRKLVDSKYNERLAECKEAFKEINSKKNITSLADATMDDLNLIKDPIIKKRAAHVISENSRVLDSMKYLKDKNIKEFGSLLTASHKSLQEDYNVTGKELDSLVYSALDFPGCIGARMTGAGFGGCAIALVDKRETENFINHTTGKYKSETSLSPEFYEVEISDGVKKI